MGKLKFLTGWTFPKELKFSIDYKGQRKPKYYIKSRITHVLFQTMFSGCCMHCGEGKKLMFIVKFDNGTFAIGTTWSGCMSESSTDGDNSLTISNTIDSLYKLVLTPRERQLSKIIWTTLDV